MFNAAVLATLTAESMGLASPTRQQLRTAVEASADVLKRRVHRAIRSFAPGVLDADYGETSSNVKIGIFRYVLRELDAQAYSVQILFEVLLPTEDLS
jgi:hypothetical protein